MNDDYGYCQAEDDGWAQHQQEVEQQWHKEQEIAEWKRIRDSYLAVIDNLKRVLPIEVVDEYRHVIQDLFTNWQSWLLKPWWQRSAKGWSDKKYKAILRVEKFQQKHGIDVHILKVTPRVFNELNK